MSVLTSRCAFFVINSTNIHIFYPLEVVGLVGEQLNRIMGEQLNRIINTV